MEEEEKKKKKKKKKIFENQKFDDIEEKKRNSHIVKMFKKCQNVNLNQKVISIILVKYTRRLEKKNIYSYHFKT